MTPLRWEDCLQPIDDMIEHVGLALQFSEGKTIADLELNRQYQLAILHALQTIGEAARRIPPEIRHSFPSIPWNRIVGLRSKIVHDYDGLQLQAIGEILASHLGPLQAELLQLRKVAEAKADEPLRDDE